MPEKLIREIPLIQRYARHNKGEDYAFRSFLKNRLKMDDAELERAAAAVTDEVWSQIDCLSCGNCCRTLRIVVDAKDIARLARRLGVTPGRFSHEYVVRDADGVQLLKSQPCRFLGSDNRCAVYADRPQACRDFPYLHEGDLRSRTLMMIDNTAVCPIVFNTWDRLKDRLGFRRKGRQSPGAMRHGPQT